MVTIEFHEHPFTAQAPVRVEANCVGEWLLATFRDKQVLFSVYRGQPSTQTEITHDVHALLQPEGHYVVLQAPGGSDAFAFINPFWAFSGKSLELLVPKVPSIPGNVNRTQQSQNNALGQRSNALRLLERIEDIYGTVRAFPALLQPVYSKYVNHRQVEFSLMCLGRGWYEIDDVRDGDTLFSDISGSGCRFYNPFTSPNSGSPFLSIGTGITEGVNATTRSNNVTGAALRARNQFVLTHGGAIQFKTAADAGTTGDQLIPSSPNGDFFGTLSVGDTLSIAMTNYGVFSGVNITVDFDATDDSINKTGIATDFSGLVVGDSIVVTGTVNNNGTYVVSSIAANKIVVVGALVNEAAIPSTFSAYRNYTGTYTVASLPTSTSIELTTATWQATLTTTDWYSPPTANTATVTNTSASPEWTGWVALKDPDMTRIICNIIAPQGMFADSGSGKSLAGSDFAIEYQQLDGSYTPTGSVSTTTGSLIGATTDERAATVDIATGWTGPTRVRMRRTNSFNYSFEGTVIDEIKWQDLYAVTPITDAHFGNVTLVQVMTTATARALAVKERQLNCRATRRIPTYNGTTFSGAFSANGSIASGTISGSRKFVDILAAVAVDPAIGRRTLATDVDIQQVWGVYQQVAAWNPLCGEYSYTLDSDNISFEETVRMIADACFCVAYRQNGKIRFSFDKAQATSTALFTHRNKRPASDSISRKFAADSEYDGVELTYNDTVTDASETIKLPLDGSASNYKKLELAGIRNYEQAWYRAQREYNRLFLQRVSIETETTADGRLLLPNQRIDIVDNTRFDAQDGEVIGQSGLELTLSRDVTFGAGAHSILLMKRDGSLQSIACTAGSAPNIVVLAALPAEALVTDLSNDGVRTIFSFGPDSAAGANAWLVQEVSVTDASYCRVSAINYDAGYYAGDTEAIPARSTVL